MKARISKTFGFEAAHRLTGVPLGHKCERLHGHSYKVTIAVVGYVNPTTGMVIDFARITSAWQPLYMDLDHYYLNDIEGLENPTSEVLSKWIWDRLDLPDGLLEVQVIVAETCTSRCEYSGPEVQG